MRLNLPSDALCAGLTLAELFTYYDMPWRCPQIETVKVSTRASIGDGLKSSRRRLIAPERSRRDRRFGRDRGEPLFAGAPTSTSHTLSGRMRVAVILHESEAWQQPRVRARLGHFPIGLLAPRAQAVQGGLSGWRRKRVTDYIDDHLGEAVRLSTLAALVDLSPYHFARAFRQSFGVPPHRYHIGRRIERAKTLLAEPANSVTAIARSLGFAETSSFSATFRRITGCSPSQYRRCFG